MELQLHMNRVSVVRAAQYSRDEHGAFEAWAKTVPTVETQDLIDSHGARRGLRIWDPNAREAYYLIDGVWLAIDQLTNSIRTYTDLMFKKQFLRAEWEIDLRSTGRLIPYPEANLTEPHT